MLIARCAVLGCRCCLRRHLQLANLALRKPAVVIAGGLLLLLLWLLGLLGRLWWLRCLVHVWLLVWSVEVYTGRRRWYLALCLKQSRLQIDDIVAQLVVLGLKSLVEFA